MSKEKPSEESQAYEVDNLYVRILKTPMSCCGVIQQGWEGKVAYMLEVSEYMHSNILVLEDGTLVWEHNCEVVEKPRYQ